MIKSALYHIARSILFPIRPIRQFLLTAIKNRDFDNITTDGATAIVNNGFEHIERAASFVPFLKLNPEGLIADVGAATGKTALLFTKLVPGCRVVAFEPLPSSFEALQQNTRTTTSITSIQKALGREPGVASFHANNRPTTSSLLKTNEQINQAWFEEQLAEKQVIEVAISTLDAEIPANEVLNILKMDVQGFELEVLKGGIQTLQRTAIVVLEVQNHEFYVGAPKYYELDAWLRDHGFELYDILPGILQEKKLYEFDSIYINSRFLPGGH
jgi:FkbM family methyltransferase